MAGSSGLPKSIDSICVAGVFPLDVLTLVLMLPGALVAVPPLASVVLHVWCLGQVATALMTVPYELLLSGFSWLPVPLKSFDCLASSLHKQGDVVVQAVVEACGVTADMLIKIDWPGAKFRFRKPTVAPLLSRTKQAGAELLNVGGHGPSDVLITEKPVGALGTFRLSEPSWIPDPSLLSLVNVTDKLEGLPAVPPGATTAGLVAEQPVCPPPQITIEYGLLLAAVLA
jgi:hypothetical protein